MENNNQKNPVENLNTNIQSESFDTQKPVTITKKKKLPIIKLLLFIFVISVIGIWRFIGYKNYQLKNRQKIASSAPLQLIKPTEISKSIMNLETYTNNNLGFSIKYNAANQPDEMVNNSDKITDTGQQIALINFGFLKNNGFDIEITTGDNIDYYKNQILDQIGNIDKEETTIVDGVNAIKLIYKQIVVIDKIDVSKVIVNNNNRDYIITALSSDIDQILTTFKFINKKKIVSVTTTPTSGNPNITKQIGYIKKAYDNNDQAYIDIDYIEWLEDDSAPNGFRIENDNPLIHTFKVDPTASIYLIQYTEDGNTINPKVSFDEFIKILNNQTNTKYYGFGDNSLVPFWITINIENYIAKIKQQYAP